MTEGPLNHLGDDALRGVSLGLLTGVELADVLAHLDDCPACCLRTDQLATGDRLVARLQRSASRSEAAIVSRAQRRSAVRALHHSHEAGSAAPGGDPVAAPVVIPPAPMQVGEYEILAEVGRGGMGVVYKTRHRGLNRLAALKMVLAGEFASPSQELRFRLEAELAARVRHPNIVQVYEIGSYLGRPFLAMEWVEGGSLANRLDGLPWPPGEAASLIETLARAIDVAHGEGVVHRDLKPANILFAVAGGGWRVAGGRRKDEQQGEGDVHPAAPYTLHPGPSTLHPPPPTLHPHPPLPTLHPPPSTHRPPPSTLHPPPPTLHPPPCTRRSLTLAWPSRSKVARR